MNNSSQHIVPANQTGAFNATGNIRSANHTALGIITLILFGTFNVVYACHRYFYCLKRSRTFTMKYVSIRLRISGRKYPIEGFLKLALFIPAVAYEANREHGFFNNGKASGEHFQHLSIFLFMAFDGISDVAVHYKLVPKGADFLVHMMTSFAAVTLMFSHNEHGAKHGSTGHNSSPVEQVVHQYAGLLVILFGVSLFAEVSNKFQWFGATFLRCSTLTMAFSWFMMIGILVMSDDPLLDGTSSESLMLANAAFCCSIMACLTLTGGIFVAMKCLMVGNQYETLIKSANFQQCSSTNGVEWGGGKMKEYSI